MMKIIAHYIIFFLVTWVLFIYLNDGPVPTQDNIGLLLTVIIAMATYGSMICGVYLYKKTKNIKWAAAGALTHLNAVVVYHFLGNAKEKWETGRSFIDPP